MKIINITSLWVDGKTADWVMKVQDEDPFSSSDSFPIPMTTAHRLIDFFQLKNNNPTGDPNEDGIIMNVFE